MERWKHLVASGEMDIAIPKESPGASFEWVLGGTVYAPEGEDKE